MLSFSRQVSASRLIHLVLVAALTVAFRLPFLLHADRFFDSDEAVEGLMARHVQQGELPIFLWGQHYKGVPEVYLAAAVFAVAGSSVIALKATTLACFVAFVCVTFVAVETLFSRREAWLTAALLIAGPPSLVLWSLSANAEVVLTLLAGSVMTLEIAAWRRSGSRAALAVAGGAAGFALWVHQYIVYYFVALAVAAALDPRGRATLRDWLGEGDLPRWVRLPTAGAIVVGVAYVVIGLVTFAQGGFDVVVGGLAIGLRNPQKLWRIGVAVVMVAAAVRVGIRAFRTDAHVARSAVLASVGGFLLGYAPALAASVAAPVRAPMGRTNLVALRDAGGSMLASIPTIALGFRSPTTEWLVSPWWGVVLVAIAAGSFVALQRRSLPSFFHVLLVVVPIVFMASGSFVDAQSYRYVMVVYGALPIVLAIGIAQIGRWNRAGGVLALVAALGLFAMEQRAWYQRLAPDARSAAIVECLDREGARGAFGDYWLSYKITFLTGERVIVAPIRDDRQPALTAYVRSLGVSPEGGPCRSLLLQ